MRERRRLPFGEPGRGAIRRVNRTAQQAIIEGFGAEQQGLRRRELDRALPVEFQAIAVVDGRGRQAEAVVGRLNAGAVIGEADPDHVLQDAVEQGDARFDAGEQLAGLLVGLRRVGEIIREIAEILAGRAQMRVGIAQHKTEADLFGDIEAQLGCRRDVVVAVADAFFSRRQQIQRRHGRIARPEMGKIKGVADLRRRSGHPERLVEGLERPAFQAGTDLGRAFAFGADDIDHPAQGVGAVEAALRAAQNFDPRQIGGQNLAEIKPGVGRAGVVDLYAVDQNLGVAGVGAANEHRGQAARPAALHQAQTRRRC